MSIMDTSTRSAEPADVTDEFDLDIRIAVGKDADLPSAGFSCSWWTCHLCSYSLKTQPFCCA